MVWYQIHTLTNHLETMETCSYKVDLCDNFKNADKYQLSHFRYGRYNVWYRCLMQKLRIKDKVALVIAVLTALATAQAGDIAIDVLLAVAINVGIVYGVAAILSIFKKRS